LRWRCTSIGKSQKPAGTALRTLYDHALHGFTGTSGTVPAKGGRTDVPSQHHRFADVGVSDGLFAVEIRDGELCAKWAAECLSSALLVPEEAPE
jgi:hypothetical protein